MNRHLRWLTVSAFAGAMIMVATPARAASYVLNVQPIQVCDDAGASCANSAMNLFSAETNKIWEQAGILVSFAPWMTVNDSNLLNSNNFGDFTGSYGGDVVNLWFTNYLDECGGTYPTGLYGCGNVGAAGVVINDLVFSYNSGVGRLDTIAHELGHNLGLRHNTFGAGGADNLMSSGSVRSIPGSLADICPDGACYDFLTAEQIAEATSSGLLQPIPEPATLSLIGLGILALRRSRRRRA